MVTISQPSMWGYDQLDWIPVKLLIYYCIDGKSVIYQISTTFTTNDATHNIWHSFVTAQVMRIQPLSLNLSSYIISQESLRGKHDNKATKGDRSKCSSDRQVLYCLISCESSPYTWELEPQRLGWLTGLWSTGQTITGIYTVNDEENKNVTHSGMLVALTMNTNETWNSLE